MKVFILALSLLLAGITGEPFPDADPISDDQIRGEIEIAARDSAILADELAAMLAQLEEEEEEDGETLSVVAEELEKALEATEELSKASKNRKVKSKKSKQQKQRSRKPKQNSSFVDSLINVLDLEFDEDFQESGKRNKKTSEEKVSKEKEDQKERKGKSGDGQNDGRGAGGAGAGYADQKEEEEVCEGANPSNKVKVCVPDFETKPQRLHFYSQETYDEEYCYYKTLTQCDTTGSDIKRDVCTFKYLEKTHNVPATNVQVSFERHSEKMGVTNCKHVKSDYGKIEEVCEIQYVSQHFKLPIVEEEVLELVPVKYPEPEEACQEFNFQIPEVTCKETQDNFCVMCAHIKDTSVEVEADQVYPSRYGQCSEVELSLPQQRCTIERKVKVPAPRVGYGAPRTPRRQGYGGGGYGGGFTAFQG